MDKITRTYTIEGREPRKRCIVVLMDGTWNDETGKDGDGVVTNVVKLFRCLRPDSDTQIVRYFRGVGNDEENGWWGIKRGGAFGRHEKSIRDNAYSTIVKEYHPGDRILIFGFSRGAASARMLAAQLNKQGIPKKITITTQPKQNRYTRHIETRFVSYEVVDPANRLQDVEVEFLGVWDTVGAFGIPVSVLGIPLQKINLFKDMQVSSNVNRAVHLVSIDETRKAFVPTLMNSKPGVVEEVWFPGVHSDIGGGYAKDELGRISLDYMIHRLKAHINGLDGHRLEFVEDKVEEILEKPDEYHFHFHGLGYKKGLRQVYVQANDERSAAPPLIHDSVFDLQDDHAVYSVLRKKRKGLRKNRADRAHIIYNPINLKPLEGSYVAVATTAQAPSSQPLSAGTAAPRARPAEDAPRRHP